MSKDADKEATELMEAAKASDVGHVKATTKHQGQAVANVNADGAKLNLDLGIHLFDNVGNKGQVDIKTIAQRLVAALKDVEDIMVMFDNERPTISEARKAALNATDALAVKLADAIEEMDDASKEVKFPLSNELDIHTIIYVLSVGVSK